jgi:lysyl-tRNA synthetase class 2
VAALPPQGPLPDTNELIRRRLEKLEALRAGGTDPFGRRFAVTHWGGELGRRFHAAGDDELKQAGPVVVAGRVVALRHHGKACFAHLRDQSGQIQLYARADGLGERYALFTDLDVGDFIGVSGELFRTRTGELTVAVRSFEFLAKSLRPLPEKWHGLKDVETRYRRRYVDLVMNPHVREVFVVKSRLIREMRAFLDARGFLEVETPMMQPIPGGAAAKPFVTHHNALDMALYLRIAPELYLKRLVVGGLDRVYEINRSFRNEGISTQHNPEFTMLEFYQAYADYEDLMTLTEEMFALLGREILGTTTLRYQGEEVSLAGPWRRLTFFDAISAAVRSAVGPETSEAALRKAAVAAGVPEPKAAPGAVGLWKDVFDTLVEPGLVQPTFITDFPIELSPLSRRKGGDPRLVDRFELFICRREIANAYSELNDPIDQRHRFEEQARQRERGDEEAHWMDEDFVRALEYGMPPTAGEGIGIDRLAMLFTDSPSIRDVILFPHLRPERSTAGLAAADDEEGEG